MSTMTLRRSWRRAGVVCVCLLSAACASGGASMEGGARSSRSPITRSEIGDRTAVDLYTLVQQLRPNWLQTRGQVSPTGGVRQVRVAIDGRLQPSMDAEALRTLHGAEVKEIRFIPGQDAQMRYGMDTEGGVILVTTDNGKG